MRIILILLSCFAVLCFVGSALQRKLLYFPSHEAGANGLSPWYDGEQLIGFFRGVPQPKNVWLMLHGNGGQAASRTYALPCFSPDDSVYILEYPGYGERPGAPSMKAFNAAARRGYELLRAEFPRTSVCAVGESIGTGPTCSLGSLAKPPDKIVLIVPFDLLSSVAAEHFPFLPAKLILLDKWNNVESLQRYQGPVEIFGAKLDKVIPIHHARALAASKPQAVFHEIDGGHNEWARPSAVQIRKP